MMCFFPRQALSWSMISWAAFLLLFLGIQPSYAVDADSIGVEIFTQDANGKVLHLDDSDVVSVNDRLVLRLRATEPLEVDVRLTGSGNPTLSLAEDVRLETAVWTNTPDRTFTLLPTPGLQSLLISVKGSGGEVFELERNLIVLSKSLLDPSVGKIAADQDLRKVFTGDNSRDVDLAGDLIRVSGTVARSRAYQKLVAQFDTSSTQELSFRGADPKFFDSVADGVVLVATPDSIGSGALISSDGLVVTNWHVIDGYDRERETVGVFLRPDRNADIQPAHVKTARVIRVDELTDLALLKLVAPPKGLRPLRLASSKAGIGADVHAIGHPAGLQWTYSRGYVSQVRDAFEWKTESGVTHRANVIQTQTPISPGSSGGPLFLDDGQVLGINSFIDTQGSGLNFAVAVEEVQALLRAPESRRVRPEKPEARKSSDPCIESRDLNGDGIKEVQRYDADCNGKPEFVLVDEDGDGSPDYSILDRNENGSSDGKIVFDVAEGGKVFDLWLLDEDEDGITEMIGTDLDRDGEPENWRRV